MRPSIVLAIVLVLVTTACGQVAGAPDAQATTDAPAPDARATTDAPPPTCDPLAPFGAPVLVPGLENVANDDEPRLTPDELAIYFGSYNPDNGTADIYFATRASISDPFGAPTKIAAASDAGDDFGAWISPDQLTLLFASSVSGVFHLYVTTRASTLADFGAAALVAGVGSGNAADISPFIASDGALWFASNRAGGVGDYDVYRAPRSGTGFGAPVLVSELSSSAAEQVPILSDDLLTAYFMSTRAGGPGNGDIWRAHRASTAVPFPAPTAVTELNGSGLDAPGWLSADQCRLYMQGPVGAGDQLYIATRSR